MHFYHSGCARNMLGWSPSAKTLHVVSGLQGQLFHLCRLQLWIPKVGDKRRFSKMWRLEGGIAVLFEASGVLG